jgi:shikimate kinase
MIEPIDQKRRNLIYLAGFMGSGKSTIGPILANTLGYRFVDIDLKIEDHTHKSISSIFREDGEPVFRTIERNILQQLSTMADSVISLGGGTIANEENFRTVSDTGIIIYLQIPPEEALNRMRNKVDRPVLRAPDGSALPPEELESRIHELLQKRSEYYKRADIVISTAQKKVGLTVDEIITRLRHFGLVKEQIS